MSATDTLSRHLELLGLLSRYPGKITVPELRKQLEAIGFNVDVRTVPRNLVRLSLSQQLACDGICLPYRWNLTSQAPLNPANVNTPNRLAYWRRKVGRRSRAGGCRRFPTAQLAFQGNIHQCPPANRVTAQEADCYFS